MRWHQQEKPLVAPLRIRSSVRWLIFCFASLALFTGLISVAEAQNKPGLHPPIEVHREYQIIKGHRVLIETHQDFFPRLNSSDTPVGLPVKHPAGNSSHTQIAADGPPPDGGDKTVANSTPSSNCPVIERSTDDNTNSFQDPNTPSIKVIYALTSDADNQFSTLGTIIEAGASAVSNYVAQESGNTKSVRFDLGTANGASCLDIQKIALPHDRAYYADGNNNINVTFNRIKNDVHSALGPQPAGARNYLIYYDDASTSGLPFGLAERPVDDSVAGKSEGLGGYNAVLFGSRGTDFFGSSKNYAPGTTSYAHLHIALHELSHNLGAVQDSAPNSSLKSHCTDQWDIMCYRDGGKPMISPPPCQGVYSSSNEAWDCNKNDYFNPAPAPGSYLATHWNVYNSVLMCPVQDCASPDTTPPTVTIDGPPSGSTLYTSQPSLTFSSPESRTTFECSWDSAAWQACSSPGRPSGPLADGNHSFAVRGTDPSHNVQNVPSTRSFIIDTTRPKPRILSLNLVGGHGGLIGENDDNASFSYSYSPSGLAVSCSVDNDPLKPCPANNSGALDWLDDGAHTFHLQVTDPVDGESVSASSSFTFDTEAPGIWFTSKVPKKIHKHSLKFSFASSESPSSFVCQLDSKAKVGCTSGYAVKHLKKGRHEFTVWAMDQAGNRSDPATARFEVK